MKKIYVFFTVIICCFLVVGCGKKEVKKEKKEEMVSLTLENPSVGSVVFQHPKSRNYTLEVEQNEEDYFYTLTAEKEDLIFDVQLHEGTRSAYETHKKSYAGSKHFKEYTWNNKKYEGYTFSDNSVTLHFNIILEEDKNGFNYMLSGILYSHNDSIDVYKTFNSESIQSLFESMKFEKK